MTEFDKIVELLEKSDLSAEEKIFLETESNKNGEVKKFISAYSSVSSALSRKDHIDEELMGEYILLQNEASDERIVILLSHKIAQHLSNCKECMQEFEDLKLEYSLLNKFVSDSIVSEERTVGKISSQPISFFYGSKLKYAFATVASLFLIYFGLLIGSNLGTPDYLKIATDGEQEFYSTRGRTSELFQRGLDAVDEKNFTDAVEFLKSDIEKFPNDESIFYSHFVLGLTYLNKAESDFLGLFKNFEEEDVLLGIKNLNRSIELNDSGRFDNLIPDAHYFIGKAYLLIKDTESAKSHLKLVIEDKGSYYKRAEKLLKVL